MADRTPSTPRFGSFTLPHVAATPTLTPNPDSHPVEVVGRIREHPDGKGEPSVIQALSNGRDLRITSKEHQQGYRVFSLDGVSKAEDENLEAFYQKYAEARVDDVKAGGKCTIMMYGPTGAGKSHTMFGSGSERGVAYHALIQIMGENSPDEMGCGQEVKATVWEIFNEEIYDLLAQTSNPAGSMKGQTNRVKLEVKGKKVRNSLCINDYNATRLLKEIHKVEKRRVTKSTNCNDRSSRSHCVVTFEVPAVDGRLVLVDMAGSENIEQAGIGMESKMQTGKINQGNGALKRVVEAIANGENHIPYRDSKLTMLLQESFEDKNAKVLMILCASPDPKDLYKTLGTFEYGAKAKRIVRLPNSPARDKATEEEQQKLAIFNAKDVAKDACILKLRREKEKSDREKQLKEREVNDLRKRVDEIESQMSTKRNESEVQLHEYRRQAERENELTRRRLEELVEQLEEKEKEVEFQRLRAEKAEAELNQLKRISFSNLEKDPDSADWGSMKQHGVVTLLKVESPGRRAEKSREMSPLCVQDNKSNVLGHQGSNASPKEKKEKKFSSSVLSFFKGSDSGHNSKKPSQVKVECKSRESPPLPSPKSEKKRQAGQEAPSPKTAEKKRHTGPDVAISATNWQPSLQQLLKVKEEQVSQDVNESSTYNAEDAHESWFKNLSSKYTDQSIQSNDLFVPDASNVHTENVAMDMTPEENASMSDGDDDEERSRQVERDPLGLITWSETKLHRKGWLPIIIEEQEEEGEGDKQGKRSSEDLAKRGFSSCPRFSDGAHVAKFGVTNSVHTPSTPISNELYPQFFPSNLLRDKFSPLSSNEERNGLETRMEDGDVSPSGQVSGTNFPMTMDDGSSNSSLDIVSGDGILNIATGSVNPDDPFLQRLQPNLYEADDLVDRLESSERQSQARDDQPVVEAASARKARIENIFLLCGHRREIAARTGAESPLSSIPASPNFRDNRDHLRGDSSGDSSSLNDSSPLSTSIPLSPLPLFRERDNQSHLSLEVDGYYSPARSPFRPTTSFENRLKSSLSPEVISSVSSPLLPVLPSPQKSDSPSRHPKFRTGPLFHVSKPIEKGQKVLGTPENSSLLSPQGTPPTYSSRKPNVGSAYGNENGDRHNYPTGYITDTDVYVKWESKDASGKFICVLRIPKGASLEDLRREIMPYIGAAKHGFSFLMLGDAGAPVEHNLEADLRVGSLPDCPSNQGSRLASLRPPSMHVLYMPPSRPFRPIENTLPAAPLESTPNGGKLVSSKSLSKLGSASGKPSQTTGNSSLVKGLRTLANGVGLRGGSTSLKERASSLHVQELGAKYLA